MYVVEISIYNNSEMKRNMFLFIVKEYTPKFPGLAVPIPHSVAD